MSKIGETVTSEDGRHFKIIKTNHFNSCKGCCLGSWNGEPCKNVPFKICPCNKDEILKKEKIMKFTLLKNRIHTDQMTDPELLVLHRIPLKDLIEKEEGIFQLNKTWKCPTSFRAKVNNEWVTIITFNGQVLTGTKSSFPTEDIMAWKELYLKEPIDEKGFIHINTIRINITTIPIEAFIEGLVFKGYLFDDVITQRPWQNNKLSKTAVFERR